MCVYMCVHVSIHVRVHSIVHDAVCALSTDECVRSSLSSGSVCPHETPTLLRKCEHVSINASLLCMGVFKLVCECECVCVCLFVCLFVCV